MDLTELLMAAIYQCQLENRNKDQTLDTREYHRLIASLLSNPHCDINVYCDNASNFKSLQLIPSTALQCAADSGNLSIVQLVLKHARFILHPSDLIYVCFNKYINVLNIINNNADAFMGGHFLFNMECLVGKYRYSAHNFLHPMSFKGTALMGAVFNYPNNGESDAKEYQRLIIHMLNRPECDPNAFCDGPIECPSTVLQCAIASMNSNVFELLCNHHRVVPHNTDLTFACKVGNSNAVSILCTKFNSDVNKADIRGSLPVFIATTDILHLLMNLPGEIRLAKGPAKFRRINERIITECDLNIRNDSGYTPLHYATKYESIEMITLLLSNVKCNKQALTNEGESALSLHIRNRNNEIKPHLVKCRVGFLQVFDILCSSTESINAATHTLALSI